MLRKLKCLCVCVLNAVAGNVVCLDSDSESDTSVSQRQFKLGSTVQLSKSVTLERISEKSDVHPQTPAEFLYGGSSESLGTPIRATSGDKNCILDPFGSGSGYSPLIDGPTIPSISRRADSNRRNREGSEGKPGNEYQFLDYVPNRNLQFDSITPEVRGSNKDGEELNASTTLNIPSARSLLSELPEVELRLQTDLGDEGEGQVGAVRKKRKVAGGKALTEEVSYIFSPLYLCLISPIIHKSCLKSRRAFSRMRILLNRLRRRPLVILTLVISFRICSPPVPILLCLF